MPAPSSRVRPANANRRPTRNDESPNRLTTLTFRSTQLSLSARGAGQRRVEQLLTMPADVNGEHQSAGAAERDQQRAEFPGVVVGEAGELQLLLLPFELGDECLEFGSGHLVPPWLLPRRSAIPHRAFRPVTLPHSVRGAALGYGRPCGHHEPAARPN